MVVYKAIDLEAGEGVSYSSSVFPVNTFSELEVQAYGSTTISDVKVYLSNIPRPRPPDVFDDSALFYLADSTSLTGNGWLGLNVPLAAQWMYIEIATDALSPTDQVYAYAVLR